MDIKKLAQVQPEGITNLDLSETGNNLVTDNVKIKAGNLNGFITFLALLTAGRTIVMPDRDIDLGEIEDKTNDLVTLSGVPANSTDLGAFTGMTLPDGLTVKDAFQFIETYLEGLAGNATSSSIEETKYMSGEMVEVGDVLILRGGSGDDPKWFKASASLMDNNPNNFNLGTNYGDSDVIGIAKTATLNPDEPVTVIMQGEAIVNSDLIGVNNYNCYLSDGMMRGQISIGAPDDIGTTVIRLGKIVSSGVAGVAKIYVKPVFVGVN